MARRQDKSGAGPQHPRGYGWQSWQPAVMTVGLPKSELEPEASDEWVPTDSSSGAWARVDHLGVFRCCLSLGSGATREVRHRAAIADSEECSDRYLLHRTAEREFQVRLRSAAATSRAG